MILYNMRERGPYEYDKFTLNSLQIHNAITLGELKEFDENEKKTDSLTGVEKSIDTLFNSLIGTENNIGLCEKVYLQSYKLKGGI